MTIISSTTSGTSSTISATPIGSASRTRPRLRHKFADFHCLGCFAYTSQSNIVHLYLQLFTWILENLPDLEYIGSYYTMVLQVSHKKFYELSYSRISSKVMALRKDNHFVAFPSTLVDVFEPYTFSADDLERAKAIYTAITKVLGKLPKASDKAHSILSTVNSRSTTYHFSGFRPTFSASDLKRCPQLYMLYRHGSDWMKREGMEKGKSTTIFRETYAFTIYAAWMCYVDTIGRMMLNCPEYTAFRDKFFTEFISPEIQPSLSDFSGRAGDQSDVEEPQFCNWDSKILDIIKENARELPNPDMNVIVKPLADETPKEYIERAKRVTQLRQSLQRMMESILKNPLVHGPIKKDEDYSKAVRVKKDDLLTKPMLQHLRGLLLVRNDSIL